MQFKTILVGAILAATAASTAGISQTPGLAGRWMTDDRTAIVTIAPCGAALCGRISRFLAAEPAGGFRDTQNPDSALRTRPLLGVTVLSNLTRSGGGWSGRAYSPREGRDVRATVTLRSAGVMRIHGCVAIFCRDLDWTRAP